MATLLDQEQIERSNLIAPRSKAVELMPDRTGVDVAAELGGRLLVRYLTDSQVTSFLHGSTDRPHWVTPTPVASDDVVSWLALPSPKEVRHHALILDPEEITVVKGPSWIRLGLGIEYFLPQGFPKSAVLDVGAIQVR